MPSQHTVRAISDLLKARGYVYIDRFGASMSEDMLVYLGPQGDKVKIIVSNLVEKDQLPKGKTSE